MHADPQGAQACFRMAPRGAVIGLVKSTRVRQVAVDGTECTHGGEIISPRMSRGGGGGGSDVGTAATTGNILVSAQLSHPRC
jgi:hypothetical protein